jgi:formylglycine-generating enzyme required for sulfatase activity
LEWLYNRCLNADPGDDLPSNLAVDIKVGWARLLSRAASVREAAFAAGLRPTKLDDDSRMAGVASTTAGVETLLDGLARRLDAVDKRLGILVAASEAAPPASPQQRGLVNVFVGEAKTEIRIANTEIKADAKVDFSALARAIDRLADLTGDFVETVRDFGPMVTRAVSAGAEAILKGTLRVTRGLRTIVWRVRRQSTVTGLPRPGMIERDSIASAGTDGPDVVWVPPGSFTMGAADDEGEDDAVKDWLKRHSRPPTRISFARGVWVGRYPVTVAQFRAFAQSPAGRRIGNEEWDAVDFQAKDRDRHPVVNVSWLDAQAYVDWLSAETGRRYRLLSEAEWEYACRAGSETARYWGDAWDPSRAHAGGDVRGTLPVGRFEPNDWGLHDMLGNVWEWTADWWNDDLAGQPADGRARQSGDKTLRVVRGGPSDIQPEFVRAADRDRIDPENRNDSLGFRVARTF